MIKKALAITIAVFLTGCTQVTQFVSPGTEEVIISADTSTPVVVVENRRPTMRVTVPDLGADGVATLSSSYGGVEVWRTADNTSFSFRDGVVVSTRGLGDDLMGADVAQSITATRGGAGNWGPRINGYMNSEYQPYFTTFQCRRTGSTSETIQITATSVAVRRTDETCVNDAQQIENSYWRNGNGVMMKSRQWVSEGVGYMETERVVR